MEAIKYYVKGAFVGIAETPDVLEQQEELIADLSAKVADLVEEGRSEQEALGMAIASMGDLSGLVREFAEPTEPFEPVQTTRTVDVRASVLQLHSASIAAVVTVAALFVLSVFALAAGAMAGPAMLLDLMFGVAAVGWIGWALIVYHTRRDEIAPYETGGHTRLRNAVVQWALACVIAFLLNVAVADGFWAWTIWVAVAVWPLKIFLEDRFVTAGRFVYPPAETSAACVECAGSGVVAGSA